MEQPAGLSPSPSPPSFAGLLASLTSPAPLGADNEAGLTDDVVTISCEQALRNYAGVQLGPHGDSPSASADDAGSADRDQLPAATGTRADEAGAMPEGEPAGSPTNRNLRTASVTIRLSEAECALLRERAAEAELTVSAYLRSCVLEADALRAQVKEALAKMKVAVGTQTVAAPVRTPFFGWIRRIWKRK